MSHSKKCSKRPELLFLDYDIDELTGPNLPTKGDMVRYYFNCRHAFDARSNRAIARMAVEKCIKIWRDNEIPTTHSSNGVKYLQKIIREFNEMKSTYKKANKEQRCNIMIMWRRKCELLFFIATKDAHEKCSAENREKLLAAKKESMEFDKAARKSTLVGEEEPEKKAKAGTRSSKVLSPAEDENISNNNNGHVIGNKEPESKKAMLELKSSRNGSAIVENSMEQKQSQKNKTKLNVDNVINAQSNVFKRLRSRQVKQLTKQPSDETASVDDSASEEKLKKNNDSRVNVTPKAFKQLHDNQSTYYSPNQKLRELLKQQGWKYIKKNPTWKLAVVTPPSNSCD